MTTRRSARFHARLERRLGPGIGAFVVALVVFALVAYDVVHGGPLTSIDIELARQLHAALTPTLTTAMLLVSQAHSTVAVSAYAVLAIVLLWMRRARCDAVTVFAVVAGMLTLNVLVKLAFHRPRPIFPDPVITLPTYSFPSGHTAASTVLYGLLVAGAFRHLRGAAPRAALVALAVAAVALVGLSRILLGVHYLTDVLGACAEGAAWLALCLTVRAAWRAAPPGLRDDDARPLPAGERHG